jgi:hypothetical protein
VIEVLEEEVRYLSNRGKVEIVARQKIKTEIKRDVMVEMRLNIEIEVSEEEKEM